MQHLMTLNKLLRLERYFISQLRGTIRHIIYSNDKVFEFYKIKYISSCIFVFTAIFTWYRTKLSGAVAVHSF